MMWFTLNSALKRFVVIWCCIHHVRPKTIMASLARWNRNSNDVAHPLIANKNFRFRISSIHFVPMHPIHSSFWAGSDWIDVKGALQQICCLKICLDFCVKVYEFCTGSWFPIVLVNVIVLDEIENDSLEYMGVKILDSLSARMRQPPEDVDHLHCSPSKTLR